MKYKVFKRRFSITADSVRVRFDDAYVSLIPIEGGDDAIVINFSNEDSKLNKLNPGDVVELDFTTVI